MGGALQVGHAGNRPPLVLLLFDIVKAPGVLLERNGQDSAIGGVFFAERIGSAPRLLGERAHRVDGSSEVCANRFSLNVDLAGQRQVALFGVMESLSDRQFETRQSLLYFVQCLRHRLTVGDSSIVARRWEYGKICVQGRLARRRGTIRAFEAQGRSACLRRNQRRFQRMVR